MSDNNLNVRATISATNEASPAIRKVIADLEKLKSVAKSFSSAFSNVGKAAFQSLDGVTRASKSAADQMRGLANVSERTAASYRNAWAKADQSREKAASRMYAQLMHDERAYQSLVAKRSSGASPSRGSGTSVRKIAGGTFLGVGAASATHQLGNQAIAAEKSIGRGIAAAFRERLRVSKAETQSEIFGDLSGDEVRKLRKDSLNKLGIKFGTGVEGTLNAATELSKAGIGKQVLGDATELLLKAKTAMDISEQETAQLFGGLASFIQFDKTRYGSIANSIAIANKSSKASGSQIIEGMKRGLSAIATTGGKLSPEQLAGLVGTAIDVGIAPGKSGNLVSHLVGAVGSADTMRGQKAKDAQEAAQHLGFGGRQQMAQSMRNNPMETIYKILDGLAKLPEKMKIRVAKDLGGEQWFDEILSMVLAKDKLKSMQKDIAADTGFLDKAALKAIRSIGGAHASVTAAAKLAQEKIGGGFDKAFTQISDAILRHVDKFDFDTVSTHVTAFVDGLRDGFGFRDWGQTIDWLVAQFSPGTIETWKSWGRGFASGLKSWGESLASAFNIIKRLTGTGNDAESTGKFAANLAVIATSLIVINPLLLLLAGTMALLASPFAAFIASVFALKKALDWVADKMFAAFVSIVDAIKNVALSMVNKVRGWMGKDPIEGSGPSRTPGESQKDFQKRIDDYTLERLKQPTSYSGATDFSSRRRNADLSDSFNTFAGKIERAAFMSGGYGGGVQYAAIGGGSGRGSGDGVRSRNFIGGVPGILTNTPGSAIPNILGNGGIIKRDNIPSFTGMGGSGPGKPIAPGKAGTFGSKAPQIMSKLMNDFGLTKEQAAGIVGNLGHETGGFSLMQEKNPLGGGRGGFGWAQWTGSRRREFEAYCKANGLDPRSDEANYGFLKQELSTNYKGAISAVKATDSVGDATRVFESTYEKAGVKNMGSRYNYANQALAGFNNPVGESMKGDIGGGRFSGGMVNGVDQRIQEIVKAGAMHLPEGYSVQMSSGFRGHGVPNHNGNAADYKVIGPDGKALSNRGDDPTGLYQQLARHSYGEMLARYPELRGKFAWGGAFGTQLGGGGPRDLMHFDINGERGRYQQYQLQNLGPVPGTQYGITSGIPTPAEAVSNVPDSVSRGMTGPGMMRGGGGTQIHINGSSHDPEALATLVQRRVDESMNWRTHDTASEYT